MWKRLHKQLWDKIEFIGINVGINERMETVKDYVKKNDLNFIIIFDRGTKVTNSFGVMGTPTHIVIDRKGIIRYRGAEAPVDMEKHIKELAG